MRSLQGCLALLCIGCIAIPAVLFVHKKALCQPRLPAQAVGAHGKGVQADRLGLGHHPQQVRDDGLQGGKLYAAGINETQAAVAAVFRRFNVRPLAGAPPPCDVLSGNASSPGLPRVCSMLRAQGAVSIALVRDKPRNLAEHRALALATTAICFDGFDRRRTGARKYVWVLAYGTDSKSKGGSMGYAGVSFDRVLKIVPSLELSENIVFWGGQTEHAIKAVQQIEADMGRTKKTVPKHIVFGHINDVAGDDVHMLEPYLGRRAAQASIGPHLGVVLVALACSPDARIQLIGYDDALYNSSFTTDEQAQLAQLDELGLVQIFS